MDADLKKAFTFMDKYDNEYTTYSERNGNLYLPREACPLHNDKRSLGSPVTYPKPLVEPRDVEQYRIITESLDLFDRDINHIISAGTGTGKTFASLMIAQKLGLKTLVVLPKQDIMYQWHDAIKKFLGLQDSDIGKIQQDTCSVAGKTIVLGMVQSLSKDKYKDYIKKDFGLVIFDEVHTLGADTFSKSCGLFNSKHRLGLSATPNRNDGKDAAFTHHIGEVRIKSERLMLVPSILKVESGFKMPLVRKRVQDSRTGKQKTVLVKMPITAGRTMKIAGIMGADPSRNSVIAKFTAAAYNKGRKIIVFSDLREKHLENLYPIIRSFGVPTKDIAYYVGGMSKAQLEKSKQAKVILATYKMVAMATDIPALDTCVLGTPKADVVQIVGRILREHPDKKNPMVFDLVDSDSELFKGYFRKRLGWYKKIKADVLIRK